MADNQEFDVVVAGSGAGGMTAALCAAQMGLKAVVIEKAEVYGGTTAVSGGGIWVPCNDQMAAVGYSDSAADALAYLKLLTAGEVPQARLEAYVANAREMVRYLDRELGVRFRVVPKYPDYYPDKPGGKDGARSMQPAVVDAAGLGDEFDRQRPGFPSTKVLGRFAMDQVEAHVLFAKSPGWWWILLKLVWNYVTDFAWRRRTPRDRRLTMGEALVASLRLAMLRKNVPLLLGTKLESLVTEQGRVTGVVATQQGKTLRLAARKGVVLATGGFESNQALREQYLPAPTQAAWSAAPRGNEGDGLKAGLAVGAATGFMNLTWGAPSVPVPGAPSATAVFVERSLPGCVVVNAKGRRFGNEAAPYTEFVNAVYADHAKTGATIPCFMVFDARFRKSYPCGPLMPTAIMPDHKLPPGWAGKVYFKADTLAALAAKIGVDPQGLARTVAQMNDFARSGVDTEFNKGGNAFDRYYADPKVKPNPCLAPIVEAPFYAMPLYPGEIGTKGGLLTDESARVLRADGSVIHGLYAVGNCSAAVMGRTYAGAGATLGPAMTFAWLAARDLASAGQASARAAA
jgi:3-oxosteroid 1-dehydrogenase